MTPDQLDQIRTLIGLLTDLRVAEIEVSDGDFKVRVMAHPAGTTALAPAPALASAPAAAEPVIVTTGPGAAVIRAAMHGIFHEAAAPGAPAFVRVGDAVAAGQQVCIVEAMKVFTPLRATQAGTIDRVHAANGQDVAAGDILFTLRP